MQGIHLQGIHLDKSGVDNFISEDEIKSIETEILKSHEMINNKTGEGKEMLGWLDLPSNRNEEEIERIKECAKRINKNSDVFVVI